MKNPVKNKESKELQKRVEKLEMENTSLKRDKRNLKRRLTTSQNSKRVRDAALFSIFQFFTFAARI